MLGWRPTVLFRALGFSPFLFLIPLVEMDKIAAVLYNLVPVGRLHSKTSEA